VDPPRPPLVWRTGNGVRSLLEISVDPSTGQFWRVTVAGIEPGSFKVCSRPLDAPQSSTEATPVFDVEAWDQSQNLVDTSARFLDEFTTELEMILFTDAVSVRFGSAPSTRFLSMGRLRFGLTEDSHFASLCVIGISESEHKSLSEYGKFLDS